MKRERIEQHDIYLSNETINHFRAVNSALNSNYQANRETEKIIRKTEELEKKISQRMRETR